jgi:hypothetical protein
MDDDYRYGCFGLPYGNIIWPLVAGIILIIIGISSFIGFDVWMYIWPILAIVIGILIIIGAIFGLSRRKQR